MMNVLFVFIGGGLGAMCRYVLSLAMPFHVDKISWGTLLANVISSLLIGIFVGIGAQQLSEQSRLFWVVGFCGGFSTFSTFSLENVRYLQSDRYDLLAVNVLLSVLICLLMVLAGLYLGRQLSSSYFMK